MKIAIIGTGHVGAALGGRWARNGHEIIFGSRNPQGEKALSLVKSISGNARVVSNKDAMAAGEVLVLATPWSAAHEVLTGAPNLAGKILIDAINPMGPDGLAVGS